MSKFPFRSACTTLLTLATVFAALPVQANWPSDPTANLLIAQHHDGGNQTQPHMVPATDGGFYLSWIDYGATASIRLQRLDVDGNAMWGPNGILVYARHEGFTYDYGLSVDTSGNAVLAFDAGYTVVTGTGTSYLPGGNIVVSKVGADGTLLWGAAGVQVSPLGEIEYRGSITATSDGHVVVGWFNAQGQSVYQKLAAADGAPLWPSAKVFSGFLAGLQESGNGTVIISNVNAGALTAQKLASLDGSPLWGAGPLSISDGQAITGTLPPGYFPDLIPDGAGGAVLYYQVDGASSTTARVQHVSAAGTKLFGDNSGNGVDVSTNNSVDGAGTHNQDNPIAAFDASTGDTYVVFEDWYQAGNAPSATFAQRFNSAGLRQWSDAGLALEAYLPFGQSSSTAVPVPGGVIAAWASAGSFAGPVFPTNIVATRVNADGSYAWSSTSPAAVKSSTAQTSRLSGVNSTQGYAAFVWNDNDGAGGNADIRAQNLRYDGLLGKLAGIAPGAPTLTAATDSGASNSDKVTNNLAPQFAGTCNNDGDNVGLAIDGAVVASGSCAGGAYTVTVANAPVDGMHSVKSYEYNAAGSSPYGASSSFTMDTLAPVITLDSKPTNPTSVSDATFAFTVDGPQTTRCQFDGGAFVACSSPVTYSSLTVGVHSFAVQATDVAGNIGSTPYTWTIQPDPVTVLLDASTDSGRSNSDATTNANPLQFHGECTDGDTIKVFAGAATLGTTTCTSGAYSVSTSALTTDGTKSVSANATRGGLTGPTGTVLKVVIDRHAPLAPAITDPVGSVGPGANVSGSAEINSIVAVSDNGNVLCTALTDGTGVWSCNAAFPAAGNNSLTATATDVAGNTSPVSAPFDVSVDLSDLVFRNGFDG